MGNQERIPPAQRSTLMKKYKALMLDLDGTTIKNHPDALPSPKVKAAIAKARKTIHVCVVTSRPLAFAFSPIAELKLSSPCIIDSGAQIFDPVSQKIIWEQPIEKTDVKTIFNFAKEKKIEFYLSDGTFEKRPHLKKTTPKAVFDILLRNLTNEQADKFVEELSHISTISLHKILSWNIGTIALLISHATATKQHGIMKVAESLNISTHEMIGVGDGYNDFPLLMACGLKVAMGNAVDELKAIADYIAPSVNDDGVADVIEKFILS